MSRWDPDPRRALRDAAIEYAAALEDERGGAPAREWDRLRRAALRYRDRPRPRGRLPRLSTRPATGGGR